MLESPCRGRCPPHEDESRPNFKLGTIMCVLWQVYLALCCRVLLKTLVSYCCLQGKTFLAKFRRGCPRNKLMPLYVTFSWYCVTAQRESHSRSLGPSTPSTPSTSLVPSCRDCCITATDAQDPLTFEPPQTKSVYVSRKTARLVGRDRLVTVRSM